MSWKRDALGCGDRTRSHAPSRTRTRRSDDDDRRFTGSWVRVIRKLSTSRARRSEIGWPDWRSAARLSMVRAWSGTRPGLVHASVTCGRWISLVAGESRSLFHVKHLARAVAVHDLCQSRFLAVVGRHGDSGSGSAMAPRDGASGYFAASRRRQRRTHVDTLGRGASRAAGEGRGGRPRFVIGSWTLESSPLEARLYSRPRWLEAR